MNSSENSGGIDMFSVNQLENNDTPGNTESATFNGICHSRKDLLNWIILSMQFSREKYFFVILRFYKLSL